MEQGMQMLFALFGGLAMFLYGMDRMSRALQRAAGDAMKRLLARLTATPLLGVLTGLAVTAVLQSSSAATVMVIGFVSAGLLELPRAVAVIYGINIGTTMTAQLIAFDVQTLVYPVLFLGFLLDFAARRPRWQAVGEAVFSFGLLFEGIDILGRALQPLAGQAVFLEWMTRVKESPLLGILLGLSMTMVVQSSSATIALLQNVARQAGPDGIHSVLGLAGAVPVLLGDNIGTTVTALLACIGQGKDAARAALAHSCFNLSGSLLAAVLLPWFVRLVEFISPKGPELEVISRQIANAHTTFNVVCTLVWLPLLPVMVKIVTFLIKGNDRVEEAAYKPKFLDEHVISQPVAAMCLVSKEITGLSDTAKEMLASLNAYVAKKEPEAAYEKFVSSHGAVKRLQDLIASYISRMFSSGALTEQQAEQTAGLLYVSNNIDRIADRSDEIREVLEQNRAGKKTFSDAACADVENGIKILENLFQEAMIVVETGDENNIAQVEKDKNHMRKVQKQYNKAHLNRIKKKQCSAELTADYSRLLYSMDRIADNCVGIAEEAMEQVPFVKLYEENARQEAAAGGKR